MFCPVFCLNFITTGEKEKDPVIRENSEDFKCHDKLPKNHYVLSKEGNPPVNLQHIFCTEIGSNNKDVGFHSTYLFSGLRYIRNANEIKEICNTGNKKTPVINMGKKNETSLWNDELSPKKLVALLQTLHNKCLKDVLKDAPTKYNVEGCNYLGKDPFHIHIVTKKYDDLYGIHDAYPLIEVSETTKFTNCKEYCSDIRVEL